MSETVMTPVAATPQPAAQTLTIPQLVGLLGLFPQPGTEGAPQNWQGMICSFAGQGDAFGALPAQGQLLPVGPLGSLFSLYGTVYGGDGRTSFAIPNLTSRVAVGGTPGEQEPQTLGLNYVIAAAPGGVAIGSIGLFGGNFAPPGWLLCDGSAYSPDDYPLLFKAIGPTFGGDGGTFCVPNLIGRAAVGAGSAPGLPPVAVGQSVAGPVPGLGLTMMIAALGLYPQPGGPGAFPESEPFLGQVAVSAAQQPPSGWLPADGRLLPIQSNTALYSLLGQSYGGDGKTSFALPDLRGRMMVGT